MPVYLLKIRITELNIQRLQICRDMSSRARFRNGQHIALTDNPAQHDGGTAALILIRQLTD